AFALQIVLQRRQRGGSDRVDADQAVPRRITKPTEQQSSKPVDKVEDRVRRPANYGACARLGRPAVAAHGNWQEVSAAVRAHAVHRGLDLNVPARPDHVSEYVG